MTDIHDYTQIPEHTQAALRRYIQHRIPPGSFLNAVLTNNLTGAYMRADAYNMPVIGHIVSYLWNEAPSRCWGSVEKVEAWLDQSEK